MFPIFLSWQVMAIQRAMKRLQNVQVEFVDHKQIEEWGEKLDDWRRRSTEVHLK